MNKFARCIYLFIFCCVVVPTVTAADVVVPLEQRIELYRRACLTEKLKIKRRRMAVLALSSAVVCGGVGYYAYSTFWKSGSDSDSPNVASDDDKPHRNLIDLLVARRYAEEGTLAGIFKYSVKPMLIGAAAVGIFGAVSGASDRWWSCFWKTTFNPFVPIRRAYVCYRSSIRSLLSAVKLATLRSSDQEMLHDAYTEFLDGFERLCGAIAAEQRMPSSEDIACINSAKRASNSVLVSLKSKVCMTAEGVGRLIYAIQLPLQELNGALGRYIVRS